MFFNKNSEKAEKHAIFFGKKKKNPSLNTAKRFAWVQKGWQRHYFLLSLARYQFLCPKQMYLDGSS